MAKEHNLEKEGKAIQEISKILSAVDIESQRKIIEYIFNSLGTTNLPKTSAKDLISPKIESQNTQPPTDIRSFAEDKQPKSAIEKVALVVFYLSKYGNESDTEINSKQIQTYFKQAGFSIRSNINVVLYQTKNAGYIDTVSKGKYKITPVGCTLIESKLPRVRSHSASRVIKSKKRKTNKLSKKF